MGPNDGPGSAARGAESRAGEAPETLSVLGYPPKHLLEDLLGLIALARHGEGCPVMLLGDPGSGKTRLADSLCRWAKDDGIEVLWASCAFAASFLIAAGTVAASAFFIWQFTFLTAILADLVTIVVAWWARR